MIKITDESESKCEFSGKLFQNTNNNCQYTGAVARRYLTTLSNICQRVAPLTYKRTTCFAIFLKIFKGTVS
jgi:RNase P subunit RPR2